MPASPPIDGADALARMKAEEKETRLFDEYVFFFPTVAPYAVRVDPSCDKVMMGEGFVFSFPDKKKEIAVPPGFLYVEIDREVRHRVKRQPTAAEAAIAVREGAARQSSPPSAGAPSADPALRE